MPESTSTSDSDQKLQLFDPVAFAERQKEVSQAIDLLKAMGFKVNQLEEQYADWHYIVNRTPTDDDLHYQLQSPEGIGTHLVGHGTDERPPLSTRLVPGRAYSLTPGQRDILRDRYGLTPTRTIVVTNFATFEPVHPKVIRWVTIRSNHHVDDVRKHILISATIGDYGTFLRTAHQRDLERREAAEGGKSEDILDEIKATKFKQPKVKDLAKLYGIEV